MADLRTCSTCRHWTGSPQRRFVLVQAHRQMVETRLCEVPVVLPEWANLARHTDHNRTVCQNGRKNLFCGNGEGKPQLHPAFVHQPIRRIIQAIAELSPLTETQIKGPSRQRAISQARHAGMWCARQLTDASFPDIGRAFGMFDHTSVLYAVRMFEQRSTPEVREDLLVEVCKRTGIPRRSDA